MSAVVADTFHSWCASLYSPVCDSDVESYAKYLGVIREAMALGAGGAARRGLGEAWLEYVGSGDAGGSGGFTSGVAGDKCVGGVVAGVREHGGMCCGVEHVEEEAVGGSVGAQGGAARSLEVPESSSFDERVGVQAVPVGGVLGSPEVVRGKNWLRNQQWRAEKKARKLKKQEMQGGRGRRGSSVTTALPVGKASGAVATAVDEELKESATRKWIAQNKLQAIKAEREIAVLSANDVLDEVRRYRTKVTVATERNMVAIEKAHSTLRATGNVSEASGSRVETLLTDSSITPDSSVSLAEVRKLQKDYEDIKKEYADLLESLKKMGLNPDTVKYVDKEAWTVDERTGRFTVENQEIMSRLYPQGYVEDDNPDFREDGKMKRCIIVY